MAALYNDRTRRFFPPVAFSAGDTLKPMHRVWWVMVVAVALGCGRGGGAATPLDGATPTETPPDSSPLVPDAPSDVPPTPGPTGPSGCGLPAAAFCETFDAPSAVRGRGGDLDPRRWSAGRLAPQGPTDGGRAFPVGGALLPACRGGSPELAFPPDDTLVCDATADINSRHLLVAVAAQNYGLNSYRIRQPFDFAGRTGTIVFDAQGYATLGWISLDLTEDPIAVPSYAIFVNDEGGVLPRNGIELQFSTTCGQGGVPTVFGLRNFHEFRDYADAVQEPKAGDCPSAGKGKLNHFQVTVSQRKVEAWVSPVSPDGVTFQAPRLIFSADVNLAFSRGYVHITTHNHATLKYSTGTWAGNAGETDLDAWLARWDNVGFDGPIVDAAREYEAPDALAPTTLMDGDVHNPSHKAVNLGYLAPDLAQGPAAALHFRGVELTGAVRATLALTAWYPNGPDVAGYLLNHRWNGGAWRSRPLSAAEANLFKAPTVTGAGGTPAILGALGQLIDVPLENLVAGDNTLELTTSNVPQNYPPGVVNVDLLIHTTP